jgi:hypothetical protein
MMACASANVRYEFASAAFGVAMIVIAIVRLRYI